MEWKVYGTITGSSGKANFKVSSPLSQIHIEANIGAYNQLLSADVFAIPIDKNGMTLLLGTTANITQQWYKYAQILIKKDSNNNITLQLVNAISDGTDVTNVTVLYVYYQ